MTVMTSKSPITTHVLDTSLGRPAAGVQVELDRKDSKSRWSRLAERVTNVDGRVVDLLPGKIDLGIYRLRFLTGAYFEAQKIKGFYPEVCVEFEIDQTDGHYHIPLLLSPFGYSTYRGS